VGKATALKEKKKRSHVRTGLRQKPLVPIGPGHTDIFHAARSLAVGSSSTVTRTAVIGYGTGFGSPRGRASWWAEEGREGSVTFFVVLPSGRFGYARGWAMGHVSAVGPWDTCRPSCDKIFICTSIFFLFPFQWHIRMPLCQEPTCYVVQQTSTIRMVLHVPIY
jgi:hypothetical protein